MLDAITLERRGIPAAVVAVKKLADTTGKGMARLQGFPDLQMATIEFSTGALYGLHEPERIEALAREAAPQVADILLGKS